ncbi:hypothetical protein BTM25_20260 [Actinomadura rubteroloni]|uniref:Uncharacterized protein n=1 Tax=Actinomadura rubteroloni TaxID=1926885 RepID=A0A2P4URD5_9ACTN|nr:hypothetical protein [Actinomadura rubteroloni]POM27610.1 hypothetical protein BTM25_20260 [Actinomadura rubteroloni]
MSARLVQAFAADRTPPDGVRVTAQTYGGRVALVLVERPATASPAPAGAVDEHLAVTLGGPDDAGWAKIADVLVTGPDPDVQGSPLVRAEVHAPDRCVIVVRDGFAAEFTVHGDVWTLTAWAASFAHARLLAGADAEGLRLIVAGAHRGLLVPRARHSGPRRARTSASSGEPSAANNSAASSR